MKKHELKILSEYFNEVAGGNKKFEIRKNDRSFKVGDTIKLREFDGEEYTGNYIMCTITYLLNGGQYGVEKGYCILSIRVYGYGKE